MIEIKKLKKVTLDRFTPYYLFHLRKSYGCIHGAAHTDLIAYADCQRLACAHGLCRSYGDGFGFIFFNRNALIRTDVFGMIRTDADALVRTDIFCMI